MNLPLQEHVLSYSMYLCIAGIFRYVCLLIFIYCIYVVHVLLEEQKKELIALQKMISLLILVHETISVHTVTSMTTL